MIRKTQVVVWFLLSSSIFSICLCCTPLLSCSHDINMRGKQKEQIIQRERENIKNRGRKMDQDAKQEVDAFSPLTLYYLKWKNKDGGKGLDSLKRTHSPSSPHPPTIPLRRRKVGTKWNVNNIINIYNATTTTTAAAAATTATAAAATSVTYPFVPSLYDPPSPFSLLPRSSCSSPACRWLESWQFIAVLSMTLGWLLVLMTLYCMTRTTRGKLFLEAWSSLCTQDKKNQDGVLTKGIGYFDGSPGLRRFVLIEDEKREEDEEDNRDDLFTNKFKDMRNKGDKEVERGGGDRTSKDWNPPTMGTYILQEVSRKDVLEVGTYRLQVEEEEEVDGKKKKKKKDNKEEVEYILEGATYILQSERVERGGRGGYGHIGGIEGLYGIVGREGLRGGRGYGRIGGLGVYGGTGEVGGILGGRYDRVGRMEELYEILQDEVTGGGGDRQGRDDGLLLSVRELVGDVGEGVREEKMKEENTSGGGGIGAEGEEWRDIGGRGGTGGKRREGKDEGGRERGRETSGAKQEKEMDERGGKRDGREVHISDTWGGRKGGKELKARLRGVGAGSWRDRTPTPPPPKRAASFPMDHFLSSHLIPRKLSLIKEEETH